MLLTCEAYAQLSAFAQKGLAAFTIDTYSATIDVMTGLCAASQL